MLTELFRLFEKNGGDQTKRVVVTLFTGFLLSEEIVYHFTLFTHFYS